MTPRRIYQCAFPIFTAYFLLALFLCIPLASAKGVDPEEKVYYYLHDHLGGVDVVTDENGDVVQRKDYLPFGNERLAVQPNGSPDEAYGFTGKELDEETGLYYYGARYYDPDIGRFVSLDPLILAESEKPFASVLANPQALNGYSYVLNNPLRYVDEEGEYGSDVHYDLTYYLGLKAGLSDTVANEIAFFNDRMDTDPSTAPVNAKNVSDGTTDEYHFQDRSVTIAHIYSAIAQKNQRAFGKALHSFQDSYSHAGLNMLKHVSLSLQQYFDDFIGLDGHTDPDATENNQRKSTFMSFNTFTYIREFQRYKLGIINEDGIKKYNNETMNIWKNMASNINEFIITEDKTSTAIHSEIHKDDDEEDD